MFSDHCRTNPQANIVYLSMAAADTPGFLLISVGLYGFKDLLMDAKKGWRSLEIRYCYGYSVNIESV